ncbi:endolytic transglycosylase MltG [Anaerocolumna sp. AGMB13025]|uniref:endolytic transglycosylase MltG n=1 Tax=Anaerocolumna sp. AGMB13025 TaxID=3039116 RepID=UPI00241FA18B|nr:endolytic transglycosylase MltG [Anaerocolumna sp. AGMB13025]WFR55087.1 endolytic transglycosylase MltG [Anaerocolumna sp. AGMB13025]
MTSKPTSAQLVLKITSFILRLLLNILFYTIVVILIVRASKLTYDFSYQIFGQVTASEEPGRDIEIQISKGESTMNVASKLELTKIIVNKYSFYVKAKLQKQNIMPGTYTLNTSMTYDEIFTVITVPSAEETNTAPEGSGSSGKPDIKEDQNSADTGAETTESDVTKDTDAAGDN